MSVAAAENRLSGLEAARDKLAERIDDCEDNFALVQLIGQYRNILSDIAALLPPEVNPQTGPTNEVAARAAARKSRPSKAKTQRSA